MKNFFSFIFLFVSTISVSGQVVADDFNYPSGQLLSVSGWTSHSGTSNFVSVSSPGLTYPGYPSTASSNAINLTNTGDDSNRPTGAGITSGVGYQSALINVSAAQATGDYVTAFYAPTTFYRGRVFIRSAGAGFNFGLSHGTNTAVWDTVERPFGTTFLVVIKYRFNTVNGTDDDTSLFINPTTTSEPAAATVGPLTDAAVTDLTNLCCIVYRQGTNTVAPTLRMDGLRLTTTWRALFANPTTNADFDGDTRSDSSVFRGSNGTWLTQRSNGGTVGVSWGISTDKLAPADFTGDGKTDFAVYRQGAADVASFYILDSSTFTTRRELFGQTGDDWRVVGDWDGDGIADPAVYRNAAVGSQSYFYYRGSLNNPSRSITYIPFGTTGDEPLRGDFDGDGKQDFAVFRPSDSIWYIRQSSNGTLQTAIWGLPSDKRIDGDFDGDGKTDLTVFRPSDGNWYVFQSVNGTIRIQNWGTAVDTLVPGNYDGDGKTDIAVWRPSESTYYISGSFTGASVASTWGLSSDTPVQSAFVR